MVSVNFPSRANPHILFFCLLLILFSLSADAQDFERNYGNALDNSFTKVIKHGSKYYVLGSDELTAGGLPHATVTYLNAAGVCQWTLTLDIPSVWNDAVLTPAGDLLVVGATLPFDTNNQSLMAKVSPIDGVNFICLRRYDVPGRESFNRIVLNPNPEDAAFPYYILGGQYQAGGTVTTDDVVLLNVNDNCNINWKKSISTTNDDEWLRGLAVASGGDLVLAGNDANSGLVYKTDNTGVVNAGVQIGNRVFRDVSKNAAGGFLAAAVSFAGNEAFIYKFDQDLILEWNAKIPSLNTVSQIWEASPGIIYVVGNGFFNSANRDVIIKIDNTIPLIVPVIVWIKYYNAGSNASNGSAWYLPSGDLAYTDTRILPNGFGGDCAFMSVSDLELNTCLVSELEGELEFPTIFPDGPLFPSTVLQPNPMGVEFPGFYLEYDDAEVCTNAPCEVDIMVTPIDNCGLVEVCAVATGPAPYTYQWCDGSTAPCYSIQLSCVPNTFCVSVTCSDGTVATASTIYTPTDPIPPVALCAGVGLELDANCSVIITPAMIDDGSSDNCQIVAMSVSPNLITDCGTFPVTLTVEDWCGNISTCNTSVQTIETVPPIITCPPHLQLACDNNVQPVTTGTATATDNCDPSPMITYTDAIFGVMPCDGLIERTWMAEDECGNISTCVQNITVLDNVPPVLMGCLQDMTLTGVYNANGICEATTDFPSPTATDNCDPSVTLTFSSVPTIVGGVYPEGVTTVTWTATDDCGNMATCSYVVTVECESDCHCGTYSDMTYRPFQGAPNIPIECNDTLVAQYDVLIPWNLGGDFLCDGNGCPPTTQMCWNLTSPTGIPSGGTMTATSGFSISLPPGTYTEIGCYELSLKAICGQDTCYCDFIVKVEGDPCCTDFELFCQNLENAVTITVNNDSCKATLNIGDLPDCDYLEYVDWGDGTIDNGPLTVGAMPMHVYPGSGTYEICYLAIELDSDGFICFEKIVCETIDLICSDSCLCLGFEELSFTNEGNFIDVNCDNQVPIQLACPDTDGHFFFHGNLICSDSCGTTVDWEFKDENDLQIWSGTALTSPTGGGIFHFDLPNIPYSIFNGPGTFELLLTGHCGDAECECVINFVVPPCGGLCPDNFVQNGMFSQGTPNGTDESIGLATNWGPIWGNSTSTGDFYSTSNVLPAPLNPPVLTSSIPNNFGGMWCRLQGTPTTYREGIMNELNATIGQNTGCYDISFKLACLYDNPGPAYPSLSVFGVSTSGFGAGVITDGVLPPNSALFTPAAVELDVHQILALCDLNFQTITLKFDSGILPAGGITHIFFTRTDGTAGAEFIAIDDVCLVQAPCDTCCTDFELFCEKIENAVSISIDNELCKATLNIGDLGDCNDYIDYVTWGDGSSDGPFPSGAMPMHTYSGSGSYEICYLAIELDADSLICFEKLVCDTIDLECSCCRDSLAFFTAAPNIQTNGTLGDCFINFLATDLDSCWQISYLWGDQPVVWDGPHTNNTSVTHQYVTGGVYNVCYRLEEVEAGMVCWEYIQCVDIEVICPDTCAIPPYEDMVAWWPMDEQDGDVNVVDIIGPNNGIILPGGSVGNPNGPSAVPGKVGGALHFTSPGNTHAQVPPPHPSLNFGNGSFSIDAWIYTNMGTQTEPIVDVLGNTNAGYAFSVQGAAPPYNLTLVLGASGGVNVLTGPPINLGEWNFVAVTVSPPNATFYVKNSLGFVQSTVPIPGGAMNATNTSRPLLIGANPLNLHWNIMIDELEIFNRALDYNEILEICSADSLGKCPPPNLGCGCHSLVNDVNAGFAINDLGAGVFLFQPNAAMEDCNQVTWIWGDGSPDGMSTGSSPIEHSFATSDMFNVCMTVVRNQDDMTSCTESFCLDLVDAASVADNAGIHLFPNPTNGDLTLKFTGETPQMGSVSIRDLFGRVVKKEKLPAGTPRHDFSLSNLPAGVYLVEVLEDGVMIWVEKIVKE